VARQRIFIAVEISDRIRQALIDLQRELMQNVPEVKWTTPENLHITLHFLGDVDQLDMVPICRVAKQVASKLHSFRLNVAGIGCFPTPRRPKVLWAGLTDGVEELKTLQEQLTAPLMETGCYRREERSFTPHITLGRIASGEKEDAKALPKITGANEEEFSWVKLLETYELWQAGYCEIESVVVMTSEPKRGGMTYSPAARVPLKS
jgi:RNA 2',3'-cyclic 3'-phosphodiesterase